MERTKDPAKEKKNAVELEMKNAVELEMKAMKAVKLKELKELKDHLPFRAPNQDWGVQRFSLELVSVRKTDESLPRTASSLRLHPAPIRST